MTTRTPLLDVRNLAVEFKTLDGVVHAVNGVSFNVHQGETLGIIGESGCGKSVSALSILRLIPEPPGRIVSGKVRFDKHDLLKASPEELRAVRGQEIGMVFQDPMTSLNPVLTIGFQIMEALQAHLGFSQTAARRLVIDLLETVGIPQPEERLDDYPHHFSGGMRQRVMIAMALACNPKLLIADEPTTALDVTIQTQILDLVKRLRDDRGMAIIWITHDLSVIAELADRVIVMYSGYVVEETDVFQLYQQPLHPYTLALLESIPHIDSAGSQPLRVIPGSPPENLTLTPGCPFAPRCTHAVDRCRRENPALEKVSKDHSIACWVNVRTGRPG